MGTENLVRELQDICSSDPSRAAGTISAYMQMAQAHGMDCMEPGTAVTLSAGLCPVVMPQQSVLLHREQG